MINFGTPKTYINKGKKSANYTKKAYYTDDPVEWEEYNRVSKLYNFNIKKAKNDFYHSKLYEAGNDQRKVWKVLKSFNKYFIDSITEISDSIPIEIDNCVIKADVISACRFDIVNVEKIECFLRNIKSNGDPELMSKRIFIDALPVIGSIFADVVQRNGKNPWFLRFQKFPELQSAKNTGQSTHYQRTKKSLKMVSLKDQNWQPYFLCYTSTT